MDLLARAARGDAAAAAAFVKTQAVRVQAQERVKATGRAAAWRMIRAAS
ncbi:hypothetical protein ACIBEA_38670 [Streptomyces sp. NPDC051555]